MGNMNKLEEIEFLLSLQNQTINTRSFDDIEIYCAHFESERDKTIAYPEELLTRAGIRFKKVHDFDEKKGYLESLIYNSKLKEDIERVMISNIKKAIDDKIKRLREEVKITLGLETKIEEIKEDYILEEGGTTYETNY